MDQTGERAATLPGLAVEQVFPGAGEMARLMRAKDWSQTPLGPVETWSPSLRMMVRFLLANRFPLLLWWGPDFLQLYNDAYRPVLGTKHPQYLGRPVRECWSEIIAVIGPLIETPFNGGPATWMEDIFLEVNRHGFVEETHFTIAYSPVPDETTPNGIGGVLATVHEISEQVVGERRVTLLRDLGARSAEAKTAEDACRIAAETLAQHPRDIPFALLYLIDPDGKQTRLAGAAGAEQGAQFSPSVLTLGAEPGAGADDGQAWPLTEVVRTETMRVVDDLASRYDTVPSGPWSDPPHTAVVVPIRSNMAHQLAGLMVAGVSAHLRFNDAYAGFLDLVSSQIATAIANARAYEEERKRAEALAEIDQAKTIFFSNVSHEFRTPLTLMLGPLDDLLADESALPPDVRGQLDVIHRNGLRLLKLVNSLLDFARIESNRAQAIYAPTDLAALTADLASAFRSLIEKAGLRLVVDCPPLPEDALGPVYVDRDMWEKIVLNLLSNAFKFTFTGEIAVTLRAVDGHAVLAVRDTGTGIPPEELPRLFERFHRVRGVRSRTHEGTGIGLALVQELVHLHGGTITGESAPGAGTTFTVTIPRGAAHLPADHIQAHPAAVATALGVAPFVEEARRWLPDAPRDNTADGGAGTMGWLRTDDILSAPAPPAPGTDAAGAAPHVLLADDNADMRDYMRRLLGVRYTVEAVGDGAAALAAVRRRPPDLILADVMMPELDGFELLRALRADPHTRAIPVILLSARAGDEATIEGLEAGADDYLVKPFSAREVLARVAAHLEIARLRKEAAAPAQQLTAVFEAAADGVVIYDEAGSLVRWNGALAALFEFENTPDYAGLPVATRPAQMRVRDEHNQPIPTEQLPFMRAVRGETLTGTRAVDLTVTVPSGAVKHVSASAAPLRDDTRRTIGAVVIYRDVTERRSLERRVQEALEALLAMAAAITALPDGEDADTTPRSELSDAATPHARGNSGSISTVAQPVMRQVVTLVTLAQRVLAGAYTSVVVVDLATRAMQPLAVVGLPPEHEASWWAGVSQAHLEDYMTPADVVRLYAGGDVIIFDVAEQPPVPGRDNLDLQTSLVVPAHMDGRLLVLTVEARNRPAFTAQERQLATAAARLAALVIEREQLLREQVAAKARADVLAETNRRMDEFLGIASHEMRTPLTSVTANVQLAERQLRALSSADGRMDGAPEKRGGDTRRAHTLLERSARQLTRLDRLVGDLLDSSRIQAGKLEMRPQLCDLAEIVREAVREQRAAWPGRGIILDLPRRGAVSLHADFDRIGQVVTNYLTNALKYSTEDAPVEVRLRVQNDTARVEVRDRGPGLTREQQAHLFERFYRVPGIEQQSGSGVGLGLGLYICRTIVERHGGAVGSESEPGEGATFWFTLPLGSGEGAGRHV